jgi:hypothetical protein
MSPPRDILQLVPDSMETNEDDFVEIAPDATDGSARPCGKPGRSGPPGNKNARTHGMYALKRAVQERGLDAIDGRSALGRALREYRADLVRDLGGEENLSAAEIHLVDLAVRDRLFLDSLDAALAERPLLNRKKGSVAPALEARFRMSDSATRRLQALGLKRVKRRKSVQEIMAEISNETASMRADVDDANETDEGK